MAEYSWENVGRAWRKFFADLSGTRQQITLVVLVAWVIVVYRGFMLLETATDASTMLDAMTPVVIATVGAWFGAKWLQRNADK